MKTRYKILCNSSFGCESVFASNVSEAMSIFEKEKDTWIKKTSLTDVYISLYEIQYIGCAELIIEKLSVKIKKHDKNIEDEIL